MSKLWPSTFVCACSIAFDTMPLSSGVFSSMPMLAEQVAEPVRREAPHDVVAEGDEEARAARVALPSGAAAQLVVDAARLVALGADDVQAAGLDDAVVLDLPRLPRLRADLRGLVFGQRDQVLVLLARDLLGEDAPGCRRG